MTQAWTRITLDPDGADLFAFERSGDPGRAPVVLLHGAGGNALVWMPIAAAFADRRLLFVDMPGHGLSARPASWDLDSIADRVATAVSSHFEGEGLVWGGHSWGGKVAGLIAAQRPPACRGLVLVDPSPSSALPVDIDEFVDETWGEEMNPHASAADAAVGAREQRHWQPWNELTAAAFQHGLARRDDGSWSLRPTREDLIALATAVLHVDAGDRLASFGGSVPTLLLIAAESVAWQQITNALAYPAARQVVVPGNHWIHQANAPRVIEEIRSWIRGVTP